MIKLELPFCVPFMAPRKSGRKFYNPRSEEKKKCQLLVRSQYCGPILTGPIIARFKFEIGVPDSLSKKKKQELIGQFHTKRPDRSNMEKFFEDVLTNIIYKDDSQIADGQGVKQWAEKDRTTIYIWRAEETDSKTSAEFR